MSCCGVKKYQGRKVCVESWSHPTQNTVTQNTVTQNTVIYSSSLPELIPQCCCTTPSQTSIRGPGCINHLPDHHYLLHHEEQLGETCHSVQNCIGIQVDCFFQCAFSHFFSCFFSVLVSVLKICQHVICTNKCDQSFNNLL